MSTLAELEAEVRALRSEVDRLREEAALFFTIHRDEDGAVLDTQLRCWMVHCEHMNLRARGASEPRGAIGIDDEGPYISLFDDKDTLRALFRVSGNTGQLELLGEDRNPVVRIFEQDGHGHVAVLSPGDVPRAIMKGMEHGAAVTVVGQDGKPLALLHSNKGTGGVIVTDGVQARVEIATGEHGGMVTVRDANNRKGCVLGSAPMGNTLLLMNQEGETAVSLASTPAGNIVSLGRQGTTDKFQPAITISDLPGIGGNIDVRNADGHTGIDLSVDSSGGCVQVNGPDPAGNVRLDIHEGGGRVAATYAGSPSRVILFAAETGGLVTAIGADEASAAINAGPTGGNFIARKGEQIQVFAGAGTEENHSTLFLNNAENNAVVQLFSAPEGGTIILADTDGTTQCGLAASDAGGKLTVFSELGVERASLRSAEDGGGLHLKWGGTTGVVAAATERGGLVTTHGPDGTIVQTMPDLENFGGEEE